MRLVVCVKQVPDSEAKVTVAESGSSISERDVLFATNPYDEYAIEEAVRIGEQSPEDVDVILVSVGPPRVEEVLRRGLARGANSATRVSDEGQSASDGAAVAGILAHVLERLGFDLVLCGCLAIDDAAGEVGGRLAEILGIPHVTAVSHLEIRGRRAVAHRELDDGVEVVDVPLPALVTAQRGLNEPRSVGIAAILNARRATIEQLAGEELGLSSDQLGGLVRSRVVSLEAMQIARKGRIIRGEPQEAAAELARLLRDEAKVL